MLRIMAVLLSFMLFNGCDKEPDVAIEYLIDKAWIRDSGRGKMLMVTFKAIDSDGKQKTFYKSRYIYEFVVRTKSGKRVGGSGFLLKKNSIDTNISFSRPRCGFGKGYSCDEAMKFNDAYDDLKKNNIESVEIWLYREKKKYSKTRADLPLLHEVYKSPDYIFKKG